MTAEGNILEIESALFSTCPRKADKQGVLMLPHTENTLVQQTTADYLRNELVWDLVYACSIEGFLLPRLMNGEIPE